MNWKKAISITAIILGLVAVFLVVGSYYNECEALKNEIKELEKDHVSTRRKANRKFSKQQEKFEYLNARYLNLKGMKERTVENDKALVLSDMSPLIEMVDLEMSKTEVEIRTFAAEVLGGKIDTKMVSLEQIEEEIKRHFQLKVL